MPQFAYIIIKVKELKYPEGWLILGERRETKQSEVIARLNEAIPESRVEQFANQLARDLAGQPLADWVE